MIQFDIPLVQVAAAEQATAAAMAASPAATTANAFAARYGDHMSVQGVAAQAGYGGGPPPVVQVINFNLPAYPQLPLHPPPPPFAPPLGPPAELTLAGDGGGGPHGVGQHLAALANWATAGPAAYPPHRLHSFGDDDGRGRHHDRAYSVQADAGRRLPGPGPDCRPSNAASGPHAAGDRHAPTADAGRGGADAAAVFRPALLSPRPLPPPKQASPQDGHALSPPPAAATTQDRRGVAGNSDLAGMHIPSAFYPQQPFSPRTAAAAHARDPYSQVPT